MPPGRPNRGPYVSTRPNPAGFYDICWSANGRSKRRSSKRRTREEAAQVMRDVIVGKDARPTNWRKVAAIMLSRARGNAKAKGRQFDLTVDWILAELDRLFYVCPLSGIPFMAALGARTGNNPWAPSLDRINRHRGYVIGNVRIVCAAANFAMNTWGEVAFRELCKNVALRSGHYDASIGAPV